MGVQGNGEVTFVDILPNSPENVIKSILIKNKSKWPSKGYFCIHRNKHMTLFKVFPHVKRFRSVKTRTKTTFTS